MNQRSAKKTQRTELLNIALDLFSSKGYSETKMTEIARGSGLSVGALYLRFKNKEELCLELIKDQTKDFVERVQDLPHDDPAEALKKYIQVNLECSFKKRQLLSLFFKEYNLPFLKPLRTNFFKMQHRIITDILVAGVKRGVFRPMKVNDTAVMIFASIRGAVLLKIIFGIGDIKKMGDSLFQIISHGIRKDSR
ncbi:MAG: TetR/AcrR family transcriptional regulator [Nitrospirae bacterium]|nr:TetR/AcrR family transcriptional regulator [Nitrospirota bacterium]